MQVKRWLDAQCGDSKHWWMLMKERRRWSSGGEDQKPRYLVCIRPLASGTNNWMVPHCCHVISRSQRPRMLNAALQTLATRAF